MSPPPPPKPPVPDIVRLVRLMSAHDIGAVVAMVQNDPSLVQQPVPNVPYTVPGDTLMHIAAFYGQTPLIDLFRAQGMEVDIRNPQTGFTPLMTAAKKGHAGVMQDLLDRGADIHARNAEGATALFVAARAQHSQAANALLQAGADPNMTDNNGCTPLVASLYSLKKRNPSTTEILLQDPRTKIDGTDAKGNGPLALAAAQEAHTRLSHIKERFNQIQRKILAVKSRDDADKALQLNEEIDVVMTGVPMQGKIMRPLALKRG